MPEHIKDENTDMLFKAVLSLKTLDECYDFFQDLCTKSEMREMARRFEAARLIREGEKYTTIVEKLGSARRR
jgi:TrpR-related protein YerC/YecD